MEQLENINAGKMQPIKLVFNNEEDQQKVFNDLRNLKGKTYYKGISVKEDYTYNERLLIKQFAEQAKAQNIEEERKNSNIIWRVRGTPKKRSNYKVVHEKSEGNHNNPQLINPYNSCNNLMDSCNNCNINQTILFYSWNFGTINIRTCF